MGLGESLSSHTPEVCIIPLLAASEVEKKLGSSVSVSTVATEPGVYYSSITPGNFPGN